MYASEANRVDAVYWASWGGRAVASAGLWNMHAKHGSNKLDSAAFPLQASWRPIEATPHHPTTS